MSTLVELTLRAVGVIDEATLVPARGLTVITGETGAGKTMLVSGLGLVSGSKADSSLMRRGASRAVVEARFADLDPALVARAEAVGGAFDDGELLVTRQLTSSRSRAFVGGAQVPAALLADLAGELVTLYGQSEQVRLATSERQREVLDKAAGPALAVVLARYRENYARRRAAATELTKLRADAQARARQADLLRFGLSEIEAVAPQPGEDVALTAEARRLQAADDLRAVAAGASAALAGDEDGEDSGALGRLAWATKALSHSSDERLAALAERVAEAAYALTDVAADLASYLADLDADPYRLEAIAERQAALATLTRKYGNTVEEVLAWGERSAVELAGLDGSDARIEQLATELADLDERLAGDATHLTHLRAAAAERLATAAREELSALALPHACLEFALEPLAELGPYGAETVNLLFTANPGSDPAPLGRVASGGELSRVRLALEVTLAEPGQTFVFDEVDAGVGGATALEIGRRLKRLAEHSQVLVVTHLAQVAAFADSHWVIVKQSDGQVSTSGLTELSPKEREAELARMMAGLDAASAKAHARDLLKAARGG